MFHVYILKLCPNPDSVIPSPLPETFDQGKHVFLPQAILLTRHIKVNHHCVTSRLPRHNIIRFAPMAHGFVTSDLARTSTTPTQARLTAEFQEPAMHVALKRIVSSKAQDYL